MDGLKTTTGSGRSAITVREGRKIDFYIVGESDWSSLYSRYVFSWQMDHGLNIVQNYRLMLVTFYIKLLIYTN